jgi:hypothetical protein
MRDLRALWRGGRKKWLVFIVAGLAGFWSPWLFDGLDTNWRYAAGGFSAGVLVCDVLQEIRDRTRLRSEIERADEQRLANQRGELSPLQ